MHLLSTLKHCWLPSKTISLPPHALAATTPAEIGHVPRFLKLHRHDHFWSMVGIVSFGP
jgi:hypothetical protein